MMSAQVQDHAVRTEADVAASVIAVLLDQHIISAKPEVLRMAADKVGVSVEHIRHEWNLLQQRGYRRPHLRPVQESGILTPDPSPPTITAIRRFAPKPRAVPGMRWCRNCQAHQPRSEFIPREYIPPSAPIQNPLRSSCFRSCQKHLNMKLPWQISAEGQRFRDQLLVFIKAWLEGRVAAGEHVECPKCHRGVKAGEATRLVVTLEHVSCP